MIIATPDARSIAEEYSWLDGQQNYIVCAYYTPNYAAHASALKRSLEVLQINHYLKHYESRGSKKRDWHANTRIKPTFIAHCLDKFPEKHILYVDADAIVKQQLSLLDDIETDLAVCVKPIKTQLRIAVGTVFVRNSPGGRQLVKEWIGAESDCGPLDSDSNMLHIAVGRSEGVSLTILPPTYRTVEINAANEPVILHLSVTQHARQRKRYTKAVRQLWFSGGVTGLLVFGWFICVLYDVNKLLWLSLGVFIAGGITLTRFFVLRRKHVGRVL